MRPQFETSVHIFVGIYICKSESHGDQEKIKIGVIPFVFVSLDIVDSKYMWKKGWKNEKIFKVAPRSYIHVLS